MYMSAGGFYNAAFIAASVCFALMCAALGKEAAAA
jgi:hypothetical protein